MITDYRALCAELADELSGYASANPYHDSDALVARARAALAQPEPEVVGPTDEELDRLEHPHWEETGVEEWGRREAIFNHRSYARAVLARYGHQPAPPAEGEVAELVAWLRANALTVQKASGNPANGAKQRMNRAADLLSQRHSVPEPVSERLPGPEDCDAEGRCWLFSKVEKEWRLIDAGNPGVPHLKYCFSHWLPAKALPLPQGDVGGMSKPPLWEVMRIAYFRSDASTPAHRYSNQIRAVADWIEQRQIEDYAVTLPDVREVIGWLTAEADRAERGDG